jgi:hypothetical protein
MPNLIGDPFIYNQAVAHPLNEIEDCAIAVDAAYYLQLHLDVFPGNEPLLPALGGLTGIQGRLENELDQWKAHKITPFFIFDGQSMAGQDEAAVKRGLANCLKADISWDLYFNGRADEAVTAFGQSTSTSAICACQWHSGANFQEARFRPGPSTRSFRPS